MISRLQGRSEDARLSPESAARITADLFNVPNVQRFHDQAAGRRERRGHARRKSKPVLVLVSDASDLAMLWVGWVLNWSQGGMAMALIGPRVSPDEELLVSWGQGSVLQLTVPTRVAYCLKDQAYWIVGCEFLESVHPQILDLFAEPE